MAECILEGLKAETGCMQGGVIKGTTTGIILPGSFPSCQAMDSLGVKVMSPGGGDHFCQWTH